MNDPRGSLWRKWDLHIHTPASFHWTGARYPVMPPAQADAATKAIIEKVNGSDVAVFAIVDYWTFDGYLRIRDYEDTAHAPLAKTLFPGIELRVEAPTAYRLNAQVIFTDAISRQELHDFKAALQVPFPNGQNRSLSDEALIGLTHSLGTDKLTALGATEALLATDEGRLLLGSKAARVTRESLKNAIAPFRSAGRALVVQPYDTSGGVEKLDWKAEPLLDDIFLHFADAFETRDQSSVELFHGAETPQNQHFLNNFLKAIGGRPKPVVCGSDAHAIANYGVFPGGRCCWIKADPSFLGLLQTVNEPAARTYIGEEPRLLTEVHRRPTRFLSSVQIRKATKATEPDPWFDASLPLNHELVAIIGNKGSGKSALADVLGLLGSSHNENHFSFLNDLKFRSPKDNKARSFEATAEWASRERATRTLDTSVGPGEVERVTYLPQSRIEEICNELNAGLGSAFDCELKSVIFSHIPREKRLGAKSLDELLGNRKGPLEDRLQQLRIQLTPLNERIARHEMLLTPAYRASVQKRLEAKQREVDAHDASKPAPIQAPEADPAAQAAIAKLDSDIQASREKLGALELEIRAATASLTEAQGSLERVRQVRARLETFQRQFQTLVNSVAGDLGALGLQLDSVVELRISFTSLDEKAQALTTVAVQLQQALDVAHPGSLAARRAAEEQLLPQLQAQLAGPARDYERYRTALTVWEAQRAVLIGAPEVPGSLEFERSQLVAIDLIPALLADAQQQRLVLSQQIFETIRSIAAMYQEVYEPVQRFAAERKDLLREFPLSFSVAIRESGLEDALFTHLNRGATGSFAGVEEGARMLQSLLARHDLNSTVGVVGFLQDTDDHLHRDFRVPGKPPALLPSQLRKNHSPEAVYDVVFGLSFLVPTYSLQLGSKDLGQLSPGERGALLLAFYLLIDQTDTPLIIDQPEENLDNETVYTLLGTCIRSAKTRRQLIMVTHNPNLAVACDAEQIICARHTSDGGNKVEYRSGAIENPELNTAVLNVLEGTRPAFLNRESKYF